jgi:hypothetical protein
MNQVLRKGSRKEATGLRRPPQLGRNPQLAKNAAEQLAPSPWCVVRAEEDFTRCAG